MRSCAKSAVSAWDVTGTLKFRKGSDALLDKEGVWNSHQGPCIQCKLSSAVVNAPRPPVAPDFTAVRLSPPPPPATQYFPCTLLPLSHPSEVPCS